MQTTTTMYVRPFLFCVFVTSLVSVRCVHSSISMSLDVFLSISHLFVGNTFEGKSWGKSKVSVRLVKRNFLPDPLVRDTFSIAAYFRSQGIQPRALPSGAHARAARRSTDHKPPEPQPWKQHKHSTQGNVTVP